MSEQTGQAADGPLEDKPPVVEDENAEFDAAFDEMSDPDAKPAEKTGAPAEEPDVKPEAAEAAEAVDDKDEKPDAPGEESPDEPEDIWAGASEAQRKAWEAEQKRLAKLEHETKSNRQRMSHLTRRNAELEAKFDAAQSAEDTSPDGGGGTPAASKYLASDDWKSLRDEYPEFAGPVESVINGLQSELESLRGEVAGVSTKQAAESADAEEAILTEAHPDWEEVTAAPEFFEWVEKQPAYVQAALAKNGNDIVDGEESADIIGRYKQFAGISADPKPEPEPNKGGGSPSTVSARRQRQLNASKAGESRGEGGGVGPPDDFDAAFDYEAAKRA